MVVIPKGSRNIRLEEVEEAANYIAIQSAETDEYYLNGQWYINNFFDCVWQCFPNFFIKRTVGWTGEYRAGVTLIYYRREGEQEEVHIPGPTLENLRFLVITNPFRYYSMNFLEYHLNKYVLSASI